MKNYLMITVICTLLLQQTLGDLSLQEQNENEDQLNPVNQEDNAEDSANQPSKRTIFGPHKNVGWVKHVIIKNGHKKLLGYSPIDYKFAAIPRPVIVKPPPTQSNGFSGYYYPKPPKNPAIDNTGWKPIVSQPAGHIDIVQHKPQRPHIDVIPQRPHIDLIQQPHVDVVQQRPHIDVVHQPHLDVLHTQPFPHVDQVNLPPHLHQVPLDGHIHLQEAPGHFGHVHLQPTGPIEVVPHVHQAAVGIPVHQHIDHARPVAIGHVDHGHLHAHLFRNAVPATTVFEVTKPNLGVLPFGTSFPSPILREAPHVHYRAAVVPAPIPVHPVPAVPAQPVVPAPHVHQILAEPAIPHLHAHQVLREAAVPHLHAFPEQHALSTHFHTQPGVLVEHHGNLAHRIVNHHPHQHLPVEEHNFLQQPLPSAQLQVANQQGIGEHIPAHAAHLNIPQQALPLEGEQHAPHLDQNHLIQPGQTDIQIPFHLPNHPGWHNENIVKPSNTLEPPYKK